jgi:ribonuclease VapC
MFLDASAIVAVLSAEAGWEEFALRLNANESGLYISPLVRFETIQALARKHSGPSAKPSAEIIDGASRILDALIGRLQIEEVPVSAQIGALAVEASGRYGKIVGHPAALNFGDCFAYACAKALGVPLLYKGNDFALTDLA